MTAASTGASRHLLSEGEGLETLRPSDHGRMQRAVAERAVRRALHAFYSHRGNLAVALDQPLGCAALELDMDKLRGDLG